MTVSRLLSAYAVAFLAAAFSHAEPSVPSLSYEPMQGVFGPPVGTYAEAQVLVPASFAPGSVAQYRFAGQESWISFDRPLYLNAFAGEERRYTLEFQSSDRTSHTILSYLIDMRAPEPPILIPPPGDIEGSLSLGVEGAGDLFISIDGSPFEPFPASRKILFTVEEDATRIVSATVYAVDAAGNISRSSSARWRLHPLSLTPSYPFTPGLARNSIALTEKTPELTAELVDLAGSARLTIKVPEGTTPCVAVNSPEPFKATASYVELSGTTVATCLIPFPWGYETEIAVHYGYIRDDVRYIVPEPARLSPSFPADEAAGAPPTPVAPMIRIEESTAYIDWPASPWTILFSIGSEEFSAYQQPIRCELRSTPVTLRYYMLDRIGSRSATASVELPPWYTAIVPLVNGVENGKTYGAPVLIAPQGVAKLRYEVIEGNAIAPLVGSSSPVLGQEGLRFEGKAGEIVRYHLRVIAESPAPPKNMIAATIQERFISFSVDRQPPPVPATTQGIHSFSSSDSTVSFKPQQGSIFVSISENGQGPFIPYSSPMSINGSDEGRKRYVIRAYSEDEFGNRSKEMPAIDILIDRSSLYTDASGRPEASGSPDDPIQFLDDAIEAAQATGKRFVYVRGEVALRRTVVISKPLTIAGGFDEEWNDSAVSASIFIKVPPSSSSWAFVVDGGSISLIAVALSMNGEGAGGIAFSRSGSISVHRSTLALSGGIDMTALKSAGSSITVDSSSMNLSNSVTAHGIESNGAPLKLDNSTIHCDSTVKLFDAIRISDADAFITGLRLEATPSQALSAINSVRSTVYVESAAFFIAGGASSCRIFTASASSLTVSSVYIEATWKGSTEAFNALNGSTLRVAHVTALIDAPRAVFVSSTGSNFEIFNSIASFPGSTSAFIRSDTLPISGTVSANSLWGFSRYLDGRLSVTTLAELNQLMKPAKPNFSEDPARMFSGSIKGLFRLSKLSACLDGGNTVEWASRFDLLGTQRNTPEDRFPDIGAEEL
ncbi:MAG: hypothetical protein A2Z96_01890 [Spirochaetes bacterium GWB1_48_6]|nr:MAG: hypothetical protein A2Z96_01890 [Spirochaetes bacterium GWB1_48_6]